MLEFSIIFRKFPVLFNNVFSGFFLRINFYTFVNISIKIYIVHFADSLHLIRIFI